MPEERPEWLDLIIGPLHKIGLGVVTLLMTLLGLLVWFVTAPLVGLWKLGSKRRG